MYTTIYCLYKDNIPFYIGKSNKPNHRKYQHQTTYGKDIIMEHLDYVLKTEWKEWEKWWIALFRSWGFELENQNSGGGGCIGNIERNIKYLIGNSRIKLSDESNLEKLYISVMIKGGGDVACSASITFLK